MAAQPIGHEVYVMKTITLLGLAGIAFVSLSQPTWTGPRGGGGFAGGGHVGGGGRVGGFAGGGFRAAPAFRGACFTSRSVGRSSAAPRFYYGGNRMTAVRPHGFTRPAGRYTSPYAGRMAAANRQPGRFGSTDTAARRQPNRVASNTQRNRASGRRTSTAANRQSFL